MTHAEIHDRIQQSSGSPTVENIRTILDILEALNDKLAAIEGRLQSLEDWQFDKAKNSEKDICGLCGLSGADKIAAPIHWPGERIPDGPLVHDHCEEYECRRAHAQLSEAERIQFLRTI